jgi:hypothetical protein
VAPWSGRGLAPGRESGADTGGRGAAGEAEELPEEEEERRGSEGPHWKKQKPQGLHYKQKFPTDLKP